MHIRLKLMPFPMAVTGICKLLLSSQIDLLLHNFEC
jgi:hypothetical protein